MRTNLLCCTDTICDEIAHKRITRNDVALTYALAIKSAATGVDQPDWGTINRAIINRWSMSALEYIKKRAFDILAGRA